MICMTTNKTQLIKMTKNPVRRLSKAVEVKPTSQVVNAPPKPPKIKIGAAFSVACAPKIFVKRDIFVGKTAEVPKPRVAAPIIRNEKFAVNKITTIPAVIINKLQNKTILSDKNRKNNGATARPTTKNEKKTTAAESQLFSAVCARRDS